MNFKLTFPANFALMFFISLFVGSTGCQFENLEDDGFGRVRSNSGYGAIDGISGFVHLLELRDLKVRQSGRISPLIERYDTIIWAPNRDLPPSDAAIERLQSWVNEGRNDRRLIFIGPGFRSRNLLNKKQIELADDENLERAIRRYNEKLMRYDYNYYFGYADEQTCKWYEVTEIENEPITNISGPWSSGLPTNEMEIYTGIYDFRIPNELQPISNSANREDSDDDRATVLLTGDGHNLVFRIPPSNSYYDDDVDYYDFDDGDAAADQRGNESSGTFIVTNGSFLQNFGLVNVANQMLANRVANQCAGNVLVLQSGPQPIDVTESLAPEQNGWAWLQQRPLREIAPFFLLLATFTFFAVFPIHGRPKRIRLRPEKSFADHIGAIGQLLKSSKGRAWAEKAIQKYHDSSPDKKSN